MNTQTTINDLIFDPQAIELFLCRHQSLLRASRADQAWQQERGPAFLREAVAQSVIDFELAGSLHSPSPHPVRKGEQVELPQPEARHTWRLVQWFLKAGQDAWRLTPQLFFRLYSWKWGQRASVRENVLDQATPLANP